MVIYLIVCISKLKLEFNLLTKGEKIRTWNVNTLDENVTKVYLDSRGLLEQIDKKERVMVFLPYNYIDKFLLLY